MKPIGECGTCGYPGLRPEGHAEWCERLAYLLTHEDKLGPVRFRSQSEIQRPAELEPMSLATV